MRNKQIWGRALCLLLCLAFAGCDAGKADPLFARAAMELARLQAADERSQALYADMDGDGWPDAVLLDAAAPALTYLDGATLETISTAIEADDPIAVFELVNAGARPLILLAAQSSGSGAFVEPMFFALAQGRLVNTFAAYGRGLAYEMDTLGDLQFRLTAGEAGGKQAAFLLDGACFAQDYVDNGIRNPQMRQMNCVSGYEISQTYGLDAGGLACTTTQRVTLETNWDEYGRLYGHFQWDGTQWALADITFASAS